MPWDPSQCSPAGRDFGQADTIRRSKTRDGALLHAPLRAMLGHFILVQSKTIDCSFLILLKYICSTTITPMFAAVIDELVGLCDAELTARIEANELERRRLDAEMSAALAVAKARNLHGVSAHRSMAAFCRAKLNWSTTEAARRLGLAKAVNEVPGLGDAWSAGRFGFPQAIKLSMTNANRRVTDQLPDFAPRLLEHAEKMPYSDFAEVVDHFVERADQDGSHDDRDQAIEGRRARVVDVGGTLDVRASGGDGLLTAELIDIHKRFTDLEYRNDVDARREEHGDLADGLALARTDAQRRFDALVNVFRTATTAADAGITGLAAATVVNIVADSATWGRLLVAAGLAANNDLDGNLIDPFTGLPVDHLDSLLAKLVDPAQICETSNGVALHPHDALRAALSGHIRRVVVDSDRVVIDMGRKQRLFTGNARRAAKLLITHCEHVGCELPADWCDVDHVDEWDRDKGATNQNNAAVLCRFHNNDKHRNRWRTKRANNGSSYTIAPDGTVLMPVGARPPNFTDETECLDDDLADATDTDDLGTDPEHDRPETIVRLTALARNRLDALPRTG